MAENAASMDEMLTQFPDGHVLGMCVTGNVHGGGTFLMPFAIELHRPEVAVSE